MHSADKAHPDVRSSSLHAFFCPRSVAVIGASRHPTSLGYRIQQSLTAGGFRGNIYPVNPRATVVGNLRAFPSARELPERPDLAIVCVPRQAVLDLVDDCAQAGIHAVVVITAGFSERDTQGQELERRLKEKITTYGMRLVGPNCVGLINTDPAVRLNTTFSPVHPARGRVAFCSQSGAIGVALLAAASRFGLGFSSFISVGNEADVSASDLVEYWGDDPDTDVILLYAESFAHPRRFAEIAERVSRRKPIVMLKAGRTQAGKRAAGSHTAALATSDTAVEALFHKTGMIRVDTLEELLDLAVTLANQPLPVGRRVGIVTNAGGPAVLCTDVGEGSGLVVPELSEQTKTVLRKFLPLPATAANPVDMTAAAGPDEYRSTIETILQSGEVNSLVVIYIPVEMVPNATFTNAICEGIARSRSSGASAKPVLACVFSEYGRQPPLQLGDEKIPNFLNPEAAATMLSKAATYAEWRARSPGTVPELGDMNVPAARQVCSQAISQRGPGWLTFAEARAILTAFGLPVAPGEIATTPDEAIEVAGRLGFPVAVKSASHRVVHKTEQGLVRLNLPDGAAVRLAFQQLKEHHSTLSSDGSAQGLLIQPMLSGVEVMVGAIRDPAFGPLICIGLGGIHVELLGDVCWRMTPLTDRDADEMIRGIRSFPLLCGYRGQPPADVGAIHQVLLRIARLAEDIQEIRELDLNPVVVLSSGKGCQIVDARMRVDSATS